MWKHWWVPGTKRTLIDLESLSWDVVLTGWSILPDGTTVHCTAVEAEWVYCFNYKRVLNKVVPSDA